MLLSERQIRALVVDLILEGYKDDQRYLIEKYPESAAVISQLQPKWVSWLTARFGESPTREEVHPFEDALVTIEKFSRKDAGIGEKYRANAQFRETIDTRFPPDSRSWAAPNDVTSLTVDDMDLILGLAERKKQSVEVGQELDVEGDRIGKVGPWNTWVPTTMEKSCKIAGYDPITREPKTTWCTARTVGSNLFYHYVGRQNEDIVLFYIIKDEPSEDNDWLSVGYLNGKPVLDGRRGGLSVNRANDGLTPASLKRILGDDFDPIMDSLKQKAAEMKGVHPASAKVREAAQDLDLLKKMLKGHSKEENNEFIKMILGVDNMSPEVMMYLVDIVDDKYQMIKLASRENLTPEVIDVIVARAKEVEAIRYVCRNKNIKPETLEKIANNPNEHWRLSVAESPHASPELLRRVVKVLPSNFLGTAAQNPNMPIDVLIDLSKLGSTYAFEGLAKNKNLPSEAIDNMIASPAFDGSGARSNGWFANTLALRQDLTPEQLKKLYDLFPSQRNTIIMNPALPLDILNAALQSNSKILRGQAHQNPQVPPEQLASFINDHSYDANQRLNALRNPSMPPDALRAAYNDASLTKDRYTTLALNPSSPPDLLMQIAKKSDSHARGMMIKNPNITDEVLKKLSKDRVPDVAEDAKKELAKRQAAAVNEALSRVIRRLLR